MANDPSVYYASARPPKPAGAAVEFWETGASGGSITWTPAIVEQYRAATLAAIQKVLSSGAQEYHIGSRGLKRLSLEDLRKLLEFWSNAASAIGPAGVVSAIQTRRGVPCDV